MIYRQLFKLEDIFGSLMSLLNDFSRGMQNIITTVRNE